MTDAAQPNGELTLRTLAMPADANAAGDIFGGWVMGSAYYSTAQLKTIQEVVTLAVFALFSVFWLKEAITINHLIGFALIAVGASFIFRS